MFVWNGRTGPPINILFWKYWIICCFDLRTNSPIKWTSARPEIFIFIAFCSNVMRSIRSKKTRNKHVHSLQIQIYTFLFACVFSLFVGHWMCATDCAGPSANVRRNRNFDMWLCEMDELDGMPLSSTIHNNMIPDTIYGTCVAAH